MDGPSRHLTWRELACINRRRVQGRPVAWRGIEPGAVVAEYPLDLRDTLGRRLGWVHEAIRSAVSAKVGRDTPLIVGSGYRTPAYDKDQGGVSNWHPRAGAMDLWKPVGLTVAEFHEVIWHLAIEEIADIGAVGLYDWGCHVDIRPRGQVRLARWDYRTAAKKVAGSPVGADLRPAAAAGS